MIAQAGRSLDRLLTQLVPEAIAPGRQTPSFKNFLGLMPRMMNTAMVLLADQGVAASDRALITYCSLHRLFLALAEDFNLLPLAAECLDRYFSALSSLLLYKYASQAVASGQIC